MKFIRTALPYFIASLGFVFTASAMAQYMWLDASGRKVFSDQPPPANVPNTRILQEPRKASASSIAVPNTEKTTSDDRSNGGKPAVTDKAAVAPQAATKKDKDLEAAKKKADDEIVAKKQAEQDVRDKAKADNCERAKRSKIGLGSGARIATTNTKGEREIMDEATRIVETKRVESIIASDCK
jgi:Domain of unknown function (DUF4124)